MKKKNIFAIILFTIGLLFFASPVIFDIYQSYHRNNMVQEFKQDFSVNKEFTKQARIHNKYIYNNQRHVFNTQKPNEKILYNDEKPIAYVDIPSIDLKNQLVYYGESDAILTKGVGNLTWSSISIGDKNSLSILAGHSGLANQIYFNNVRYLKNGDIFYIHSANKKIAYKVYKKKIVDPADAEKIHNILKVQENKDISVLLTCTPMFINSHRLLVFGERVPLKDAKNKKVVKRDFFTFERIILALSIFFIIVMILMIIITARKKK